MKPICNIVNVCNNACILTLGLSIKQFKLIFQIPGHITFGLCGGTDYYESKSQQILYILPNSQRTFVLNPRQFFASETLKMIFSVKYNSVKICWSRKNYDSYLPNERLADKDEACTVVSISKGSSTSRKAIFDWYDPCDGQHPDNCLPIFFRIEAYDSGGLNCLTHYDRSPCRMANAVEIVVKHQGMSCGAGGLNLVSPVIIVCLMLSRLLKQKLEI